MIEKKTSFAAAEITRLISNSESRMMNEESSICPPRLFLHSSFFIVLDNGQLDAVLDNARADGVAGEPGGVVDVELLHEMLAVLLDGLDADAEFRRGFLVGLAFRNELEHLHLARSQPGRFFVAQARAAGRLQIEAIPTLGNGGNEKLVSFLN